jgi:secondary thiamine-phosphate synthase enzyme
VPKTSAKSLDAPHPYRHDTAMHQFADMLSFNTPGSGLHEITRQVVDWTGGHAITTGMLTVFLRHTSASLLIQENDAPAARRDLERYFATIAPESRDYEHDDEGPDDMPAHLRAALTQAQLTIPVIAGELALGTWQGIDLFEHRRRPHRRSVALHLIGN